MLEKNMSWTKCIGPHYKFEDPCEYCEIGLFLFRKHKSLWFMIKGVCV